MMIGILFVQNGIRALDVGVHNGMSCLFACCMHSTNREIKIPTLEFIKIIFNYSTTKTKKTKINTNE